MWGSISPPLHVYATDYMITLSLFDFFFNSKPSLIFKQLSYLICVLIKRVERQLLKFRIICLKIKTTLLSIQFLRQYFILMPALHVFVAYDVNRKYLPPRRLFRFKTTVSVHNSIPVVMTIIIQSELLIARKMG